MDLQKRITQIVLTGAILSSPSCKNKCDFSDQRQYTYFSESPPEKNTGPIPIKTQNYFLQNTRFMDESFQSHLHSQTGVRIHTENDNEAIGFMYSKKKGYTLAAKHNIGTNQLSREIYLTMTFNSKEYKMPVIDTFTYQDLTLLIPDPDTIPEGLYDLSLRRTPIKQGEMLFHISQNKKPQTSWYVSKSIFSDVNKKIVSERYFELAPAYPIPKNHKWKTKLLFEPAIYSEHAVVKGDSGSPTFDWNFNVVGLTHQKGKYDQNNISVSVNSQNIAISSNIGEFMREFENNRNSRSSK